MTTSVPLVYNRKQQPHASIANCPQICQLLLFTPVRTQCNHLLCASCMAQWADASSTNEIEASSFDVELTDFDPNYDPSYDLAANCPMCRAKTTAAPDILLATELEHKYPVTYAERRVEEEVEKGSRIGQDGVEGVMILIGNKHKLVRNPNDDNQHDWTFFVRTSRPELVEEVRIDLVSQTRCFIHELTFPLMHRSALCRSCCASTCSLIHDRSADSNSTLHFGHHVSRSENHPTKFDVSVGATSQSTPRLY